MKKIGFESSAEELNSTICDSLAVLELSPTGKVLHANDTYCNLVGYTLDEIVGKHHNVFIPFKDRRDDYYKALWEDLGQGKIVAGEFKRITKNHQEVWIKAVYTPIMNPTGLVTRVIKSALDISNEKELSNAFDEQLAAIHRSTAIIDMNLDGRILTANDHFLNLTGYSLSEIKGKKQSIFLPEDLARSAETRIFWEDLARGKFKSGEYLRLTKSGEKIWIRGSYNPIRDLNGKVVKVRAFAIDVTYEKKTSLHQEQTYRAIDRSAALAEFDLDGNIIHVNKNLLSLTGYSEKEVLGCHHSIFISDEYAESAAYKKFWHDLRSGKALSGEFLRHSKYNEEIWIRGTYNPIFDHQGVPYKVVKFALDITEQKKAEMVIHEKNIELDEALTVANEATRSKSEFLANMSHEIRTPLNAIVGMADILSDTELTSEQRKFVRIFQKAGDNLLEIINDILDISKVDAGKLKLEQIPFNLEESIEEVMDLIAPRAHTKGLEITLDYDPELGTSFLGDPTRVKQILTNLVGNALKFTEKGQIAVSVRANTYGERNGNVYVSVKDTGTGISKEGAARLFEKFAQEDSSITRKFGGTGLGLSLCKRFTELFEGDIWVDSTKGEGSDFQFTLQLPVADSQEVRALTYDCDLQGKSVLIVDNNSTNRMIISRFFKNKGCTILEAEHGRSAISVLESENDNKSPVDLILVDGKMPIMDGFEFIRIAKKHPTLSTIPIIMLTSDNYDDESTKAKELGAAEYLTKPIKSSELARSVMRTLRPKEYNAIQKQLKKDHEQNQPLGNDPTVWQHIKILLVDDSENNRILIQNYLSKKGIAFEVAENGLEATKLVKDRHFDAVLMDMQMPVMDGFTATEEIRRWEAEQDSKPIEIVALTAMVLHDEVKHCFNAGCDYFLPKPIKKRDFFSLLAKLQCFIDAEAKAAKASPKATKKKSKAA